MRFHYFLEKHPVLKVGLFIALITTGVVKGGNAIHDDVMDQETSETRYSLVESYAHEPRMVPIITKAIKDHRITENEFEVIEAEHNRNASVTHLDNIQSLINTPTPKE